jgi:hypothetical protein
MEIINNFAELLNHNNLREIDDNFFTFSKLLKQEFKKKVNLDNLDDDELKKLDKFIIRILRIYPQMYPYILETTTKNHNRNIQTLNNKLDERFKKLIDKKDSTNALNTYLSKYYTIMNKDEISKFVKEHELIHAFEITNQLICKEITLNDLNKEIKIILNKKISKILLENEIANLTQFLVFEIYLRCKIPEEYIYSEKFNKFIDSCENLENFYRKIIGEEIKKNMRLGKSPEEVLESLKKNYPFE